MELNNKNNTYLIFDEKPILVLVFTRKHTALQGTNR